MTESEEEKCMISLITESVEVDWCSTHNRAIDICKAEKIGEQRGRNAWEHNHPIGSKCNAACYELGFKKGQESFVELENQIYITQRKQEAFIREQARQEVLEDVEKEFPHLNLLPLKERWEALKKRGENK